MATKYLKISDVEYIPVDTSTEAYALLKQLPVNAKLDFLPTTDAGVKAYLATQAEASKPKSVTMRQGKEALIRQGKIAGVQAAIDGITDVTERAVAQNFWDNSNAFYRNNSTLIALSSALGMSASDIDALFVYAATL